MFVYVIVNSESLKLYVGQHKGTSLRQYLQRKLSAAQHHEGGRSYLFASMRKHPKEAWSIHPLISDLQTREECDSWERILIKALKAQHPDVGYNICRGGEGRTGPMSEDTRTKMQERVQAYYDAGGQAGMKGKKQSEKWKQMQATRVRGPHEYDFLQRVHEAQVGKKRPLLGEKLKANPDSPVGKSKSGAENAFFGRHHSEESKRKNAEAHRKPWSAARRAAWVARKAVKP